MPSMLAISSIVWPSIAASKSTKRNFSGNSARASSRCSWNSLKLQCLPQSPCAAGASVAPTPCPAARGVSRSAIGRAPDETRFARAMRESGCGRANARTGGTHAAKLPGLHPRRRRYYAKHRGSLDRPAGCIQRGAPRIRAACQPGLYHAPAHPRPCDLVGPEPAPAFVILRELPTLALSVQLTRLRHPRIGSVRNGASGYAIPFGLDPQQAEQFFEVGFVDEHFPRLLALRRGLDGSFIEGLKKPHLGNGIFLAARKRAPVQLCPGVQGRLRNENLEGERRLPVNGNEIGEFATGFTLPLRAIAFEEEVLVAVPVACRVALDAAYSIRTGHGRIIGGLAREVNAGIFMERRSRYETAVFPSGSK